MREAWESLDRRIVACRRCPRLCRYVRQVGREKRRGYAHWQYWARPVPNLGSSPAGLLVVGLAPGAHGANRTGRMFTGDRSGDWLFRALFRAGFASQPHSQRRGDGLELVDCVVTAACHCAPPHNRPTADELATCSRWLDETYELCQPRVTVALGGIAWQAMCRLLRRLDRLPKPQPQFAHGHIVNLPGGQRLLGSYHPSQQNTFTGRLTEPMLDDVFATARRWIPRPKNNPK